MLHGSNPARTRGAAGMMLASAALLTLPHLAFATPSPTAFESPAEGDPHWAIVIGSSVNIRSGPSAQSAYAFGKLRQGDIVRVLKEEYGWAKVSAEGPAFADVVVFVPADRRVSASEDGKTLSVNGRTELRAPNADAGSSPDKSWKLVGSVEAGSTLASLGIVDGSKESVYRVKAPASTEAWVNLQFLRRATDAEVAAGTAATTASEATLSPAPAAAATADAGAAIASTETAGNAAPVGAPSAAPTEFSGGIEPLSSPAIPPLLGEQPRNSSVVSAEPAEAPAVRKPKPVSPRATLDELERRFKAVREQPQSDAEFGTLRSNYEQLAATAGAGGSVKGLAEARARQLALMADIQAQVQEAQRAKTASDERRRGISDLVLNIQRRAEYTAVGVLNASAVYDGQQLPELYRVCDALTGATIAYVEPNPDVPLATMVGTLVGIKGGKTVDPALRLTVISPMSVELLTQRAEPQVTRTESTRPIEEAGKFVPADPATPDDAAAAPCPDNPAPDAFELVPGMAP